MVDAAEVFSAYGVFWSDFEEDIANLNLDEIEECQLQFPNYLSDHEYDRDGVILSMEMYLDSIRHAVESALACMARTANESEIQPDISFENDNIICFNYTNTVERVLGSESNNVFYIHGSYQHGDRLILGYKDSLSNYDADKYSTPETGDYYLDTQVNKIKEFYDSYKKQLQEDKLLEYISGFQNIDIVEVLGHAIGSVDKCYFEIIERSLSPKQWRVSFHDNQDPVLYNSKDLSFYDRIEFFKW